MLHLPFSSPDRLVRRPSGTGGGRMRSATLVDPMRRHFPPPLPVTMPSALQTVLCQPGVLELGTETAALDRLRIALQHLKLRLPAVAPESDIEAVSADTKVEHGQVGQPLRQQRIYVKLSPRCVRHEPQHRLHQCEDRARRPGLRYIGPKILDRETRFVALDRRIELG